MSQPNRCPQCGTELAPDTPLGLCPACLLKAGLAPPTDEAPVTAAPTGDGSEEAPTRLQPDTGAAPAHVGPYTVLGVLGEGGMGIVYLAEQTTPIHRRVALKVVKAGMDSREVLTRFQAERQALALMDHPHIARVLDAGLGPGGRPYFVMEYVPGLTITDYCDRHRLSNAERLALFLPICAAVQHAHQKGVIHRDLKPSNILVTMADGKPVPKVIDFGIAKATHQGAAERAAFTELGRLIGTPEYMSPEQAEASGLEVDTTTDIYALGVVLYELLVGALPFDPVALRQAGYAEIHRIIREQEPPKPSSRASTLGATAEEVAKRHQTTPAGLARQVRGDLDAIAMKAMEKDRTRRYASASEFAADIERYLRGDAVVARPASVAYRTKKFVRRHKVGVAAGAVVAAALVVGLVISTLFYVRAESAREASERQAYAAAISSADLLSKSGGTADALVQLKEAPAGLRGWEWNYLFAKTDTSIATLKVWGEASSFPYRHSRFVFAADGETVSWNTEGSVATWQARSRLPRKTSAVRGNILALGPSGQVVTRAAPEGDEGGTLRVVNADTGALIRELPGNRDSPFGALFSPDGRTLLVNYGASGLAAWDLGSNAAMRMLPGATRAYDFSKDGSQLLAAATDKSLAVLEFPSGRRKTAIPFEGEAPAVAAFRADGAAIAAGYADGTIRVWTLAVSKLIGTLSRHEGPVTAVGFNPDGSRIVSGGKDGMMRVWDVAGNRLLAAVSAGRPSEYVMAVTYSPDGRDIWVASDQHFDGATVRVWSASRLGPYQDLRTDARTEALTYAPDGSRIAVGYGDSAVRIWDTRTGSVVSTIRTEGSVQAVAYHPTGRFLATAAGDALRTWDSASGEPLGTMTGHTEEIDSIAYSPAGTELASGGHDGSVRIWDATSGREIVRWQGSQPVWALAFDATGSRLIFGTGDRQEIPSPDARVRVWDWRGNRIVAQTADEDIESAVSSLAVNPVDGRIIVGQWGSDELLEYTSDLQSLLRELSSGNAVAHSLAFTPDGSRLVQGSAYGPDVAIWIDRRPTPLLRLEGHEGGAEAVAVNPDGSQIAVVSGGGVRLWDSRSAYHPETGDYLRGLPAGLILAEERSAAVRADLTISPDLREAALRTIESDGDSPWQLNRAAWQVAKAPGAPAADLTRAVRAAAVAMGMVPWAAGYCNTLGVAQYRTSAYRDALATLKKCAAMRKAPSAADLAFLAMAHQKLGDTSAAREAFEKLRVEMKKPDNANDKELQGFMREAEALIDGASGRGAGK